MQYCKYCGDPIPDSLRRDERGDFFCSDWCSDAALVELMARVSELARRSQKDLL